MMKRVLYIVAALLALTACDRQESHLVVPEDPANKSGAVVGLDVSGLEGVKFTDTHIYGFSPTQKLIYHNYYPTQQELSNAVFALEEGVYTFVAVLNMGEDFIPKSKAATDYPDLTLHGLLEYLKTIESSSPEMLTGMMQRGVTTGEVSQIIIPIKKGVGGVLQSQLKLTLTLPDANLEEYQTARTRVTAPHNLRGVVEFFLPGKEACISHQTALLTPTATAGVYTLDAKVAEGTYDILVWVDYTESGSMTDLYYNTASLKATRIIATDNLYKTGIDTREVFHGKSNTTVASGEQTANISLERPLAKYRLIADDVARYRTLMVANPEKYPAIEELNVNVFYEGYLPDGFNVSEGKPNNSAPGYKYQNPLSAVGETVTEMQVASDYVIVNGTESSVSVTVIVSDRQGTKISQVRGVEVKYRRDMVTTIKGEFLSAGVINPGINIDTDWGGTHEVEF